MRQAAPYADRLDETRIAVLLARNRELEAELNLRNRQLCNFDTALDRIIERNTDEQELLGQLQRSLDLRAAEVAQLQREIEERDRTIERLEVDLEDQTFVAKLRAEVIAEERARADHNERRLTRYMHDTADELNAWTVVRDDDDDDDELELNVVFDDYRRCNPNPTPLPQGYRYNCPL